MFDWPKLTHLLSPGGAGDSIADSTPTTAASRNTSLGWSGYPWSSLPWTKGTAPSKTCPAEKKDQYNAGNTSQKEQKYRDMRRNKATFWCRTVYIREHSAFFPISCSVSQSKDWQPKIFFLANKQNTYNTWKSSVKDRQSNISLMLGVATY
jgi:hypothetical protein